MEVLGKTLDRGVKLPDKTSHKDFRFGSAPKKASAIGAKDLLYPVPEAETEEAKRLYQKSHGTFEPGVQRRRYEGENSDLGFDVQKKRFGMVGAMGDQNGVYKCLNNVEVAAANAGSVLHIVPKNVARFKESVEHKLGQCKNLGQAGSRPPNHKEHAYGVVDKSKTTWGAAECIQGSYTEEDQLPDLDAVSKLAEKEHARTGGDFNAIVQRLWAEARRELEQQREHERREDAWAAGEAAEEAPTLAEAPPEDPPQSASGEIRRRLSPAAESETEAIANPPVTPADASPATTPRKPAKRKKRPPRKSRTADEL